MTQQAMDRTGQRFGRLVVLGREGERWRCRCDCGRITTVARTSILGRKSCGCLKIEQRMEHRRER